MFSVAEFLDRAKVRANIESDYRLAKVIGKSHNVISGYRHGKSLPEESVIEQLCALSGDDPDLIAAQIQAARSKTPEARTMWLRVAALWHETPTGREHSHCDVAYDLTLTRGMSRCHEANAAQAVARLGRVLSISDTGAANDPLIDGPLPRRAVAPLGLYPGAQAGKLPDDGRAQDGPADNQKRLIE